jgi:hypothetical protein
MWTLGNSKGLSQSQDKQLLNHSLSWCFSAQCKEVQLLTCAHSEGILVRNWHYRKCRWHNMLLPCIYSSLLKGEEIFLGWKCPFTQYLLAGSSVSVLRYFLLISLATTRFLSMQRTEMGWICRCLQSGMHCLCVWQQPWATLGRRVPITYQIYHLEYHLVVISGLPFFSKSLSVRQPDQGPCNSIKSKNITEQHNCKLYANTHLWQIRSPQHPQLFKLSCNMASLEVLNAEKPMYNYSSHLNAEY